MKFKKKKEEYSEKFSKIFQKKTIDENTLKTIQQMFPNNQEINRLINDFNEINNPSTQKNQKRNKSAFKSNRTYSSFEKNKKDSSIWDNYKLNNLSINNNSFNDKNKYKNEIIQNKYNYRPKSTANNNIDISTSNTNQKNSINLKEYNYFNNFNTNTNSNLSKNIFLSHSNFNNNLNKEEIYAKYNIKIPNNNIKLSDFSNNSLNNSNFSSDKIKQYKNRLNKEYLDILRKEKEKVEERERKLEQINIDNPQRKALEEQYKKENAQSQVYLMNKKKEIDKKINDYIKEFKSED